MRSVFEEARAERNGSARAFWKLIDSEGNDGSGPGRREDTRDVRLAVQLEPIGEALGDRLPRNVAAEAGFKLGRVIASLYGCAIVEPLTHALLCRCNLLFELLEPAAEREKQRELILRDGFGGRFRNGNYNCGFRLLNYGC